MERCDYVLFYSDYLFSRGSQDSSNLNPSSLTSEDISDKQELEAYVRDARMKSKQSTCLYCNSQTTSFCNSHSVPQFVLKNIAVDGKVYNGNALIRVPLVKDDSGLNQAGTFRLICRKCDGDIFKDYETPENYSKPSITNKMLTQIAMKNYLKSISKRQMEIELYKTVKEENLTDNFMLTKFIEGKQHISETDLKDYLREFNRAKRIYMENCNKGYEVIYYEKLDYIVPIAFQSEIVLIADFEENTINNVFSNNEKYKQRSIHISIFPLKDSSVITMFVYKNDMERYRRFNNQFKELTKEEKLAAINYIIFSYSEDIYMSKDMKSIIEGNKLLIETSRKTTDVIYQEGKERDVLLSAKKRFGFSKMNEMPNLLSYQYRVNSK